MATTPSESATVPMFTIQSINTLRATSILHSAIAIKSGRRWLIVRKEYPAGYYQVKDWSDETHQWIRAIELPNRLNVVRMGNQFYATRIRTLLPSGDTRTITIRPKLMLHVPDCITLDQLRAYESRFFANPPDAWKGEMVDDSDTE